MFSVEIRFGNTEPPSTYEVTFFRHVTSKKVDFFSLFLKSSIVDRLIWNLIHMLPGPLVYDQRSRSQRKIKFGLRRPISNDQLVILSSAALILSSSSTVILSSSALILSSSALIFWSSAVISLFDSVSVSGGQCLSLSLSVTYCESPTVRVNVSESISVKQFRKVPTLWVVSSFCCSGSDTSSISAFRWCRTHCTEKPPSSHARSPLVNAELMVNGIYFLDVPADQPYNIKADRLPQKSRIITVVVLFQHITVQQCKTCEAIRFPDLATSNNSVSNNTTHRHVSEVTPSATLLSHTLKQLSGRTSKSIHELNEHVILV